MLLAKDIHKKFSESVLRGVTLEAKAGEIIGIAGKNGSGKSTLLSIMTGLLMPDGGQVTLEEEPLKKRINSIGYVPQEAALFENLSVKDNLRFWASARGLPWKETSLMLSEDKAFLKKRVSRLSDGMKRRLSIILACMHSPKWLVLDEPSANLDIGFKGDLIQIIKDISAEGGGVIFTSHQPDELMWCDRIYILRGGVFVYSGDPKELGDISKVLYGQRGPKKGGMRQ